MPRPALTSRFVLASVLVTLAASASAPITSACSGGGYGYAGLIGPDVSRGVRATVSAVSLPRVESGHVAAWVGVGGAGAGATGEDEWIQVGLVAYQSGSVRLYYELMRGTKRNYVEVDSDVAAGESHRVTVTEVLGARGWWRATVDGRAVTEPVYLAGSRRGWQPVATAENWRGDCGVNGFRFRFQRVEERESRSWKPLKQPFLLEDESFQLRRWSRGFDAFGVAQAEPPL